MIDKTSTVQDAIKNNVNAGDNIFIGGFGHLIPFYLSHELIRQKIQDLTICRSGADILFDQLIASEIVKKVILVMLEIQLLVCRTHSVEHTKKNR